MFLELMNVVATSDVTTMEKVLNFSYTPLQVISAICFVFSCFLFIFLFLNKFFKKKENEKEKKILEYKEKYEEAIKLKKELEEGNKREELESIKKELEKLEKNLIVRIDNLEQKFVNVKTFDTFLETFDSLRKEVLHFKQREAIDHNNVIEAFINIIYKIDEILMYINSKKEGQRIERISATNLDLSKRKIEYDV